MKSTAQTFGGNVDGPRVPTSNPAGETTKVREVRSAASADSQVIERLHAVQEWVRTGISDSLNEDPSGFLLGTQSVSILTLLDLIEGGILNLEADANA